MTLNDDMTTALKSHAKVFVLDNFPNPTERDFLVIETAFLNAGITVLALQVEHEKAECEKLRRL